MLALIQAKVVDKTFAVPPAFFDFDPAMQVNLATEKSFHILAGKGSDFLQHGAVLTDDYAFVAFLFTVDGGIYV